MPFRGLLSCDFLRSEILISTGVLNLEYAVVGRSGYVEPTVYKLFLVRAGLDVSVMLTQAQAIRNQ